MYTCGPTVYGRPHIGNYSSFLMADLLRRWLEVTGYKVTHVKNITDVGHLVADADEGEDKVEKEARRIARGQGRDKITHDDVIGVARMYEQQYLADEKELNLTEPEHRPRASEVIEGMIKDVQILIKKGHAYETGDGVYFSVESFKEYGKLSGNTLEQLNTGARISVDENKRHPADFALWKKCVGANEHHVLRWQSPWGPGFPGWHIECSVMARSILGDRFDIHTGGEDLIFPHHECEIAQSEGCTGKQPVNYWIHKRFIDMGDAKMSKSLGNVLTLPDIKNMGFSPPDLRYYLLSVHYRTNLKFTEKGLNDAQIARDSIMQWMKNDGFGEYAQRSDAKDISFTVKDVKKYKSKFIDAMNNDLNTPAALAAVFECRKHAYRASNVVADQVFDREMKEFIEMVRNTFGCFEPEEEKEIPSQVKELLTLRQEARTKKDFLKSDQLRKKIEEFGYTVRDTGEGQKLCKI